MEPVDVSVAQDGGILKTTIKTAPEGAVATGGSLITIHVLYYTSDGTKLYSTRDGAGEPDQDAVGEPVQHIIGQGYQIRGWEEGIPTMKIGERAKFVIRGDYNVSDDDSDCYGFRNPDVIHDIELIKREKISSEMTPEERLTRWWEGAGIQDESIDDFRTAFGEDRVNISSRCMDNIKRLLENKYFPDSILFQEGDVDQFSDLAWELFGRYLGRYLLSSDSDMLSELNLSEMAEESLIDDYDTTNLHLNDSMVSLIFRGLSKGSNSLRVLKLHSSVSSGFGAQGIRSMVPFLKNSPNLSEIELTGRNGGNINPECFGLIVKALDGGCTQRLCVGRCNIDDITALGEHVLPSLQRLSLYRNNIHTIPLLEKYTNLSSLDLTGNKISRDGCISIANLLGQRDSSLQNLYLGSTGLGDDDARILIYTLKQNTTLTHLTFDNEDITETGRADFLTMLNDVSSIERTCKSNHTLTTLALPNIRLQWPDTLKPIGKILEMTERALIINRKQRGYRDSYDPGTEAFKCEYVYDKIIREKIIETQLNSKARLELSRIQCVDYSCNPLAGIDAIFLPNILSLAGERHGQNELFQMLVATAPEITSFIDMKALLKEALGNTTAQINDLNREYAALVAKKNDLNQRLALLESSGNGKHASSCGKKRLRSASF